MTSPNITTPTRPRDGWVSLGLVVSATSAALTSFDGLRQLAVAAGWAKEMAFLLPLTVDAFAATATRIWLVKSTSSEKAKRFARACSVGAILLSLAGNAMWHLIAANLLEVGWVIVLTVGAIPPVVLGLVSHLAVLRSQAESAPEEGTSTVLSPVLQAATEQPKPIAVPESPARALRPVRRPARKARQPRYDSEDDLLNAAREVATSFQAKHGKAITRDALRTELRIGGARATELLRRLKAEASSPDAGL